MVTRVIRQSALAGICSSERAKSRTVAVVIDGMSFIRPVKLGDILCGYAEILEEETSIED